MAEMHLSFYAPSLGRTVNLRAMVPVDGMGVALDAPQEPLPALYLLHGLYGSENDWFNYTRVILWARQHGIAVFCPAGENGFYVNKPSGSEDFLRFLGEDLVNFTRKLFPLSHRREDTFIAGLSMGGYGALNAAFTYPDIFGKTAALSAALRPWTFMENPAGDALHHEPFKRSLFGDDPTPFDTLTLAQRCGARCPALWMACGTEDGLLSENIRFVDGLRQSGIPVHFDQTPGAHTWDFWNGEIERAIAWMAEK